MGHKRQQALLEKAKAIRLLILDVDGVLTPGTLYYGPDGSDFRAFNIQDGLGIRLLQRTGIKVGIISAKESAAVLRRTEELNIEHVYLGFENKINPYETIKSTLQLNDGDIAYMGDDLPDLPLLRRVGFAITVPEASDIIRENVDYITKNQGGTRAVREVCELILEAQGYLSSVIESYLVS